MLVLLLVFVMGLVPSDGHIGEAREDFVIRQAVGGEGFRFVAWEGQAIGQKLRDAVDQPRAEMSAEAQRSLVIDYFETVRRIDSLNSDVERTYAERGGAAADAVKPLEADLAVLRGHRAAQRPSAERIIEQQVGASLLELGLGTAAGIFPPVRFQLTESPNLLILSPRDRIAFARSVHLDPTMSVERMEQIEGQLERTLPNTSALVDGTGGFSSYPTMVLETSSLSWIVDTVAHEWVHTYLAFRPLGWSYLKGGSMQTVNETVASIVGEEVGARVLARYYPQEFRAAPWPAPLSKRPDWLGTGDEPPDFDYGAFMRKTRQETDRLLAAGQVSEAESYMEARRKVLLDEGYVIRRLNQAYFAFHGSYAVGAFATDPIGAKLRALRARSGSLQAFVSTMARMSRPEDLDAALVTGDPNVRPSTEQ